MATINVGCDKIENPVVVKENVINTDLYPGEGDYVIPPFGDYPSSTQNVLLEDFTGHRCGNCPTAADIAHELKEEYQGSGLCCIYSFGFTPLFFSKCNRRG